MGGYIELKDVQKEFILGDNVIKAVSGIDLSVEKGERLRISGRSGSGKSTLLNLMAGLEKTTSGQIIIDGNRIDQMNERDRIRYRRKTIGFIFQSYNLLPQYTALENVALPLVLRGIAPKKRIEMAKEIMEQVGIYSHAKHKPNEMSGGQQQRVGIARALITSPPIVFADEPTGNLDTKTSQEVMELLTKLFIQRGTTFVLVSHDEGIQDYTTRTIYLEDGRIINFSKEESN
ncbi:ABC transporter ATP-binding protein [Sporanaerobacter acetigenes]|uniref:Putative ABC transport system ATP-binding protein n=1 Tax=Sporanaerobacter acetigenes DSM 13106 TaxID=1123281 RepID=A0A1M5VHZ4_9FIRM|nr:ABC transporter ATP-binding protein [Sporanaerobacter acetigenes]SHH74847.1 putative ABC transport system ATP-binding protein [Sporanaerobacter acetigenes DSM 13106]